MLFFGRTAREGGPRDDRQLGQPAQDETVAVVPVQLLEWNGEPELREAHDEGIERELAFHASECRPEAEMDAVAEGEVADVVSIEVQRFGFRIMRAVANGGGQRDDHLSPDRDRR